MGFRALRVINDDTSRDAAQVAETLLGAGDAVSTSAPGDVVITGDGADVLVFDLA